MTDTNTVGTYGNVLVVYLRCMILQCHRHTFGVPGASYPMRQLAQSPTGFPTWTYLTAGQVRVIDTTILVTVKTLQLQSEQPSMELIWFM